MTTAAAPAPRDPHLTPREREVLRLIARGLSAKEIGLRLCMSKHTAEFHVQRVRARFGAGNAVELVVKCLAAGLLSYDDILRE